ncbi:MAG: hypothetical protein Q9175_005707 [Cornicularia normoerica]
MESVMQSDDEKESGAGLRGYAMQEDFDMAENLEHDNGDVTPLNDTDVDGQLHDRQARTAYYNSAAEKSLSHAEAKLFFQRHQLETSRHDSEAQCPLARARSSSSTVDGDGGLGRTTSTASRRAGREYAQLDKNWRLAEGIGNSPNLKGTDLWGTNDKVHFDDSHLDSDEAVGHETELEGVMEELNTPGPDFSPELSAISINIKRVLDIRHKYISLSLQGPGGNPKDSPDWRIYPPPPNPTWDDNKNRPIGQTSDPSSLSNSRVLTTHSDHLQTKMPPSSSQNRDSRQQPLPVSPTVKRRKPGQDIGEDFEMLELLPLPGKDEHISFELDQGSVYQIFEMTQLARDSSPIVIVPTLREFYIDMDQVQKVSSDGPTKSFAFRQLDILEGRFHLYFLVNSYQETADCKRVPHRDFYNVRKVDTHVHHSACMNQKHLLRFIKSKMKKSPDEVVMFRDNKELTLNEVFESINLTAYDLSIDTLDMHAHTDSFHRFDKFNLKYNPIGESRLREIFLKTDNYIKGRYLAEITKEVISDLESSKYQFVEWRVSIYGRSIDEWDKLAAWVIDNKLVSHNVRWLIQVPRLFSMYKANGSMNTFEEIIINIFRPLYEATKEPSSHPELHVFLQRVIGFDSVDDESKVETRLYRKYPPPKEWNTKQNPPYTYWIYHLFANMTSLNVWRKRRGFNTFVLRPHCGEAGDVDHIAAAVLCCHSISHGLMLRKVPLLQYVFYLDQIGIAMSPLSNNALFLAYERNPFSKYFKRGLNVSLSTDDPLQFAFTKEPLIEEYSVAAQIYRLSAVDMCELAHHSVIQSGFEHELKQRWLGPDYHLPGVTGNDVAKSNVPNIREKFRNDTLVQELEMLERYAAAFSPAQVMTTPIKAPRSPAAAMHWSQTHSTRVARIPASYSNADVRSLDLQRTGRDHSRPARSSSMITSPSQANVTSWIDRTPPPPRMFPGVVHERIRRRSLRQGSNSEKDANTTNVNVTTAPRPVPWEQDDKGLQKAVAEEPSEQGNPEEAWR